jgi:hypothetical protein
MPIRQHNWNGAENALVSDLYMWYTILGACRNCGAMDFGQLPFGHALHSEEKDSRLSLPQ